MRRCQQRAASACNHTRTLSGDTYLTHLTVVMSLQLVTALIPYCFRQLHPLPSLMSTSFVLITANDVDSDRPQQTRGVQVCNARGEWRWVPLTPGTSVVLIGEAVHAATEGAIPQSLHRVIGAVNCSRVSMAFGVSPIPELCVEPQQSLELDREQILRDVRHFSFIFLPLRLSSLLVPFFSPSSHLFPASPHTPLHPFTPSFISYRR